MPRDLAPAISARLKDWLVQSPPVSPKPANARRAKKQNWRLTGPNEPSVASTPRVGHECFDLADHFRRFHSRNLSWAGPSHLGPFGDKHSRIPSDAGNAT